MNNNRQIFQIDKWYLNFLIFIASLNVFIQCINLLNRINGLKFVLLLLNIYIIVVCFKIKSIVLKVSIFIWILLFMIPGFIGLFSVFGLILIGRYDIYTNLYTFVTHLYHSVIGLILLIYFKNAITIEVVPK